MSAGTKNTILKIAKHLFATNGYEGFSMRTLAKEAGVGLSSLYHFFSDKDEILKELFFETNKELGRARAALLPNNTASEALYYRILFQFRHIEDVVFVLKYYMHFRPTFTKQDNGYLPPKASLHIEEVLLAGIDTGEFKINSSDIAKEAKVIAHAINGYLLEYYPQKPKNNELQDITKTIHGFVIRSLINK